jgi:RNA-binding protein NOB1
LKTLKRVAVTVKDDGTKIVHINFKKPINIRGTRYSLPTPKSGKHANNLILVADQPIPQQRKSKLAIEEKKQVNCDKILTDPDYVNRLNPFAINDIYSRASRMNTNVRRVVNPNETKRPTGNRKKKRNIK